MENQNIKNQIASPELLAKSIGKDLKPISPDKLNESEQYKETQNKYLSEKSKDIVYMDKDSTKKAKIFNVLLEIKEKYPELSLNKFVENWFMNNAHATDNMIYLVGKTAKEVEKYYKKSNSDSKDNLEENLSSLRKYKQTMLNALQAIGITYKNKPSLKTVAEDFKEFVLQKSNFLGGLIEDIGDIAGNINNVSNSVGNAIGNVQNIISTVEGREDLVYTTPPQNYNQQAAQQSFLQLEEKTKKDNTLLYVGLGFGAIILVFVLIKILK